MKAVVMAAGGAVDERIRPYLEDSDLVVAADGGAALLLSLGVVPQVVVGDFDSLGEEAAERLQRLGSQLVRVQPEKDETDTELAVRHALERGARSVVLLGAIGSRLDHTLANLLLLGRLASQGISAQAVAPPLTVHAVSRELILRGSPGDTVSVLPILGSAAGVYECGFKYGLAGRNLEPSAVLGMSNELLGREGRISVGRGVLLVFHYAGPAE